MDQRRNSVRRPQTRGQVRRSAAPARRGTRPVPRANGKKRNIPKRTQMFRLPKIKLRSTPLELLAMLTTIILPPVGIVLAWKKTRWNDVTRYIATGLGTAILLLMVILIPTSSRDRKNGGVTIIGSERSTEVYGPSMPEATVVGYTDSTVTSVLAKDKEEDAVTYVFAADGAKCYHLSDCKFAFASAHKLTIYEATVLGYKPCGRCKPPVFSGNAGSAN